MTALPFVVQPKLKPIIERIGNETSGIIEVERRGFLSVTEKTFLQQSLSEDTVTTKLLAFIRKVAQEQKIKPEKAHEYVMDALNSKTSKDTLYNKILKIYEEELNEIVHTATQLEQRQQYLRAVCLILNRINPNFDMNQLSDVHPDIIEGLSKLCQDEENKSLERLEASQANQEFGSSKLSELEILEKK